MNHALIVKLIVNLKWQDFVQFWEYIDLKVSCAMWYTNIMFSPAWHGKLYVIIYDVTTYHILVFNSVLWNIADIADKNKS